jgi:hypothetical protein
MITSTLILVGYNRPDYLRNRLEELHNLNLGELDLELFIDGPKDFDSKSNVNKIEEIVNQYRNKIKMNVTFREKNLGVANNVVQSISQILKYKSSALIFEDDVTINSSAIKSMDKVLQEIDTRRYATVGAFGVFPYGKILGKINISNQYRSTPYFSAWGWGINSDVWKDYRLNIADIDRNYELSNSSIFESLSQYKKEVWLRRFDRISKNVEWSWDYQMQYMSFVTNRQHLLPFFRQVNNVGFNDVRGTNTIGIRPRWYFMPNMKFYDKHISRRKISDNSIFRFVDSITFIGDLPFSRKAIMRVIKKILNLS